jgi:hypothetical protein
VAPTMAIPSERAPPMLAALQSARTARACGSSNKSAVRRRAR